MKTIPVVDVDMALPIDRRWRHLTKGQRHAGAVLARRAVQQLEATGLRGLAECLLEIATVARNPNRAEIFALADLLGIPHRQALLANMSYEVSQLASWGNTRWVSLAPRAQKILATIRAPLDALKSLTRIGARCTAGAAYYPRLGMTLVRNLDWSLPGMGRHTVLFRHHGGAAGEFVSVGWPGYVGVLSGVAAGRFAATINQAPSMNMPSLQWPPSHLLRAVFESCRTYQEALRTLANTPVCFPAFVLLVGVKPGDAAIVELTPGGSVVHGMRKRWPIAIANDHLDGDLRKKSGQGIRTLGPHAKGPVSEHRRNTMLTQLNRRKPSNISGALAITRADWIENDQTVQQMVLVPATGQAVVIGLEGGEAVAAGGTAPAA